MTDTFTNDPFMASSGGYPALKFDQIGDTHTGRVTAVDERVDTKPDGTTKTWPDGRPMNVFIFTLDTPDGLRSLWVRGNMVTAIREAVKAAGLPTVIGATLSVRHSGLGEAKRGQQPAKLFQAKVEPPAPTAAGPDPW